MIDSRITLMYSYVELFILLTLILQVRGQMCPQGTITRYNHGMTVCCQPEENCDPNYYIQPCTQNNTKDMCVRCKEGYKLFKRTSSFAMELCHEFPLTRHCEEIEGRKASMDDLKHCHCDLEQGFYYMKPEVYVGSSSYCQPFVELCLAGFQPALDGQCEQCPKGTFQEQSGIFRYCRPQKNCSALRLDIVEMGNSRSETICAKVSLPPSTSPHEPTATKPNPEPSKPAGSSPQTPLPPSTGGDVTEIGIGHSRNSGNSKDTTVIVIVVSVVGFLALVGGLLFYGYRRGWHSHSCFNRRSDLERGQPPSLVGVQTARQDEDNNSANSDCTCTDSCLASSKPSGSTSKIIENGGAKAPDKLLFEGHINTQYGGSLSSEKGSLSEPFYHTLCPGSPPDSGGGNYRNINGGYIPPATMLRQEDFYNYPTKVSLTPIKDKESAEEKGEKKQHTPSPKPQNRMRKADDSRDSCETEPLLAYENLSSGNTTPSQGRTNCSDSPDVALQDVMVAGNRPHLSILLGSAEPSVTSSPVRAFLPPNVPHLSQLVSSAPTSSSRGFPSVQQQQAQEAATLEARLAPAVPPVAEGHQGVNPGLVQLEELKPMMPADHPLFESHQQGEAKSRQRSTSPARITPVKHEEVRRGGRKEPVVVPMGSPRPVAVQAARPAALSAPEQPSAMNAVLVGESEETFRKEAVGSPEDTARKSVGDSSGLGESLEMTSSLVASFSEGRQGRNAYRRSNSEVSRSMSPSPSKLPRSISSPEEKHRPIAAVRPIQSDQSLTNQSPGQDLMQPLDSAERNFPLQSVHQLHRQMAQDSTVSDHEETRPKTPDRLTEEEEEEEDYGGGGDDDDDDDDDVTNGQANDERTRLRFAGGSDCHGGRDKSKERNSEG